MKLITIQTKRNISIKDSRNGEIIYGKGIFISFKNIVIFLFVCAIIFLVISDFIPHFPKDFNTFLGALIILVVLFLSWNISVRLYVYLISKLEKKYSIFMNDIQSDSLKIKSYLIHIQEESKKNYSSYSNGKEIDQNLNILGDEEYDFLSNQKEFCIQYNSTLLSELREIFYSKTQEDNGLYSLYVEHYDFSDEIFYYLESQLELRINRMKKIDNK